MLYLHDSLLEGSQPGHDVCDEFCRDLDQKSVRPELFKFTSSSSIISSRGKHGRDGPGLQIELYACIPKPSADAHDHVQVDPISMKLPQ